MMPTTEEISFIREHINSDTSKLALSCSQAQGIRVKFVLDQIAGRQRIKQKLPAFYSSFDLILPKSISLEQCSSEQTAEYKAAITEYASSADLTGGMGIDSLALAKNAHRHLYIENNAELCRTFEYNAKILNIENIEIINADALDYLSRADNLPDLVYFDPSRRGTGGRKTYFIEDTEPNAVEILKYISGSGSKVLIKTSPLLDISRAAIQLGCVSEVHVVSVENECKELLLLLDFQNTEQAGYFAVDFGRDGISKTELTGRSITRAEISTPRRYIYEPNASLMKLGFWNETAELYSLAQLAPNTHLFTSEEYIMDFPGRVFSISAVEKFDKKNILHHLPEGKANIAIRNFPMSVAEIRRKTGIKEGGDIFVFAVRLADNSGAAIISRKVGRK